MKIGVIAAEASGDKLLSRVLAHLQKQVPNLEIVGIFGEETTQLGYDSWFPMSRLSVMGLWEPLKRLPELFRIQHTCFQRFQSEKIDFFLGVDAPDFNLRLAKKLKSKGFMTTHLVSPSVWAWRQNRIHLIKQALDMMLCLFPFELAFYQQHQMPAVCIGHPRADEIPIFADKVQAKQVLGIQADQKVLAVLPGSRDAELKHLLPVYLNTMRLLAERYPHLVYLMPCYKTRQVAQLQKQIQKQGLGHLAIQFATQAMDTYLAAADYALVTSGTATLEALFHKTPMLIAYKTDYFSYALIKRLVRVPYIGLPNLLANAPVVPEWIQEKVNPETLASGMSELIDNPDFQEKQKNAFDVIHRLLRQSAAQQAAKILLETYESGRIT